MTRATQLRSWVGSCQLQVLLPSLVATAVVALVAAQSLAAVTFTCPLDSYCVENKYIIKCGAGRFGNSHTQTSSNCSGICPQGYYCPAGTTWSMKRICPLGHYCPEGSPAQNPCPAGHYGAELGASSPNCSGLCDSGYTCTEGSATSNQTVCPVGHYCPLGSPVPLACPLGYYGDVEGLSNADCSGLCPAAPGGYCPEASTNASLTPCPRASYCDGSQGSSSIALCPVGTYGATHSLASSQCSGPCSPGFFCPVGSISSSAEDCGAGYFCAEGTQERKPCPPGRYGSLRNMFSSSCEGVCNEGYFCNGSATTPTYARCPAGYFCEIGETNPKDCPPGSLCREASSSGVVNCPRGYYCPGVTGDPIPCPAGTFGGIERLQNANCSGVCPAGTYCLNATVFPEVCPAGSYCLIGTEAPDQYPCPGGGFSTKTGLLTIEECFGPGSGGCSSGYYCPPGSTSTYAIKCPWNHYCPTNTSSPLLCTNPGFYCAERSATPEMLRDDAVVIILNTIPAKAVLWAQDFPVDNERAQVLGISTINAFIKAAYESRFYSGPSYDDETFSFYSRGLDTISFNVTTKGFFNGSIGLCSNSTSRLILRTVKSLPVDANPTAHEGFSHIQYLLPRDAQLGISTICVLSDSVANWTVKSDRFEVVFANQVSSVKATAQVLATFVFTLLLYIIWKQHKANVEWTRKGEIDLMVSANATRSEVAGAVLRISVELAQYAVLVLLLDGTSILGLAARIVTLDLNFLPGYALPATVADLLIVAAVIQGWRKRRYSAYKVEPTDMSMRLKARMQLKRFDRVMFDYCFIPLLFAELRVLDCTYTERNTWAGMEFFDEVIVRGSLAMQCWTTVHGVLVVKSFVLCYILLRGALFHVANGPRNKCLAMIPGIEAILFLHKTGLVFMKINFEHTVPEIAWGGLVVSGIGTVLGWKLSTARAFLGSVEQKNYWISIFHISLANAYFCRAAMYLGNLGIAFIVVGVMLEIGFVLWRRRRLPRRVIARQFDDLVAYGSKEVRAQCLKEAHSFAALTSKPEDCIRILRTLCDHLEDFEHDDLRLISAKSMAQLLESNSLTEEVQSTIDACKKKLSGVVVLKLGDAGSFKLNPRAGLKAMLSSILFLDLSKQSLADGAIKLLAVAIADATALKALNLSKNSISSVGIQAVFSALNNNKSVSVLLARSNNITLDDLLHLSHDISRIYEAKRLAGSVVPLLDFGEELVVRFAESVSHDETKRLVAAQTTSCTLPEFATIYSEPTFATAQLLIMETSSKISINSKELAFLLGISNRQVPIRLCARAEQENGFLTNLSQAIQGGVPFRSLEVGSFSWSSRLRALDITRELSAGETCLVASLTAKATGLKVIKLFHSRLGNVLSGQFGAALVASKSVESVTLGSVSLDVEELKSAVKSVSLVEPVLTNDIAVIVCCLLRVNPKVERLYIYSTAVELNTDNALTDEVAPNLAELPLKKLICGSTHGGNIFTMKLIESLAKGTIARHLISLDVSNNSLGNEGGSWCAKLLSQPNSRLKSLKLDGCALGDIGLEDLSCVLKGTCSLTKLSLGNNGITLKGADALFDALCEGIHRLQILTLDENGLEGAEQALAKLLKQDKGLRCLNVASCKVNCNAEFSASLGENTRMKNLNLAHNRLGLMKSFEFLSVNRCIQTLSLSSCGLDDDDMRELLNCLGSNRTLEVLDLSENYITDDGGQFLLEHLASKSSGLQTVCFSSNLIVSMQLKEKLEKLTQLVII